MAFQPLTKIIIICFLIKNCHSLYFSVKEGEKKCFVEEVPQDTIVKSRYRIEYYNSKSELYTLAERMGMYVDIKDPHGKVILHRTYSAEGRFAFTSAESGEHVICLHSNNAEKSGTNLLRIHLHITTGDHSLDYAAISKDEKLNELEIRVRRLLDQVETITKEQTYQREREERFRVTSDSTSNHLIMWSLLQLVTLIILGFWQARHLKTFFIKKKIV